MIVILWIIKLPALLQNNCRIRRENTGFADIYEIVFVWNLWIHVILCSFAYIGTSGAKFLFVTLE